MDKIEVELHAHHAAIQTSVQNDISSTTHTRGLGSNRALDATLPFAKVNSVVTGSPADTAGLQAGDAILSFGAANWTNHEKLGKVAQVVSQNEGVRSTGLLGFEFSRITTGYILVALWATVNDISWMAANQITESNTSQSF